jgi:antiviral helicase SLH1
MADILFRSFIKGMIDAMNAEISLGTVATVGDAVRWLGYTYLFARMQKNPLIYGELPP